MKKINFFRRVFPLLTLLFLSISSVWGADLTSPWSVTSFSGSVSNNATTINNATWTLSSTTIGSNTNGTPAWSISGSKWKFGNSKSQYWSSYTLSTNYFNDYAVTKVEIGCYDNGGTESSVTVTQGSITIGTQTVSTTTTTNVETINTTKGNGGTLSIIFASTKQASYITKLTITFESLGSSDPCTVTFNVGTNGSFKAGETFTNGNQRTEASAGAGVTLPAVDANDGWYFAGWSKDATPTSANAGVAGATFNPTQNCEVYAYYKVIPAAPGFSVKAGQVEKGTTVTLSCTTDGATIKYTTDGTTPTSSSSTYSSAIALNATQTIKAIAIKEDVSSSVAEAAYTIATHTAQFSINGVVIDANNCVAAKGEAITFPADPEVDGVVFRGWKKGAGISGTQDAAPDMVNKAAETMGTDDAIYYAVFAVADGQGEPILTKLGSGATFAEDDKIVIFAKDGDSYYGMYHETVNSSYVNYFLLNSAPTTNDISGDDKKYWTLSEGGNNGTWHLGDATNGYLYNSSNNMYAGGTLDQASDYTIAWNSTKNAFTIKEGSRWVANRKDLTGNNQYLWRGAGTSSSPASSNNVSSIGYLEIYKYIAASTTYSDYCTTVSLDPKPTIVLSATELAEYAGNTNTSITASVSEGAYTGALTVESSAEAVATASISEGTITINALTAGTATITVTAPAVTGFRKNTATIAVTVSNKLAHGLEFSADELNLTVGATEFSEPTLSNPNSLPVVYSLVYATPANEGKVATINSETGKLTLADPSLSTETQGAVTVKASTVGDNSHAAGEVTYNLVVARKVTTTSWSNSGAAVTIDKDEIATLPTASNDGERNLFYESSNTNVAAFVEGVLTFVDYGTTTITAKTSATSEYAATSATYELTFAPRYKVTFYINGEETVLREETTGAGVVAPSVDPIEGKVFRGWAEATIDGTTNDAPAFVTTASLDEDKYLYAVFATKSAGAEGSVDFIISSISNLSTSNAQRTQTSDDVTFTFSSVMDANVSGTHYVQMAKSSTLTQDVAFAGNIKSIKFEGFSYSSTNNASMLVEGKKGNGEYATVQSCGSSYTGNEISFGSNEYDFFKITVGSERTVKFTKMTVEYSGVTYSEYCTTVKTTPTLSFAEPSYTAIMGDDFAVELTNTQGVSVKYTSSAEAVATVNQESGAVTLVAPGTTTITANFAGNDRYNRASASYELVVEYGVVTLAAIDGDKHYATFSSDRAVEFVDDATIYTIKVTSGVMSHEEVVSKQVPANTGVLIESTIGTANYKYVAEADDLDNNMLYPASQEKNELTDCKFYMLSYDSNRENLGFYWGAANGVAFKSRVGTAYLAVPNSEMPEAGAPARFVFNSTNTATGVEALENSEDAVKFMKDGQLFILRNGVLYNAIGQVVK